MGRLLEEFNFKKSDQLAIKRDLKERIDTADEPVVYKRQTALPATEKPQEQKEGLTAAELAALKTRYTAKGAVQDGEPKLHKFRAVHDRSRPERTISEKKPAPTEVETPRPKP